MEGGDGGGWVGAGTAGVVAVFYFGADVLFRLLCVLRSGLGQVFACRSLAVLKAYGKALCKFGGVISVSLHQLVGKLVERG